MEMLELNKPKKMNELKTGTTIMAVNFKDGVVMGADSRATSGSYVANRFTDKLEKIDDTIYCCRSGSSADTQAMADYVRYFLQMNKSELDKPPSVKTAANLFKRLCYVNKNFLMASIICAGWDKYKGGSVYQIPLGGSLLELPFAVGGSGSTYIFGYCDSKFKKGMSKKECIDFVVNGLNLAMERDGSSGGLIRYAIITKDGVERHKILPNTEKYPKHYGKLIFLVYY